MARRYKPGRSKGSGGLGWILALACLLATICAGGASLAWFLHGRPALDQATLCPETGPQGALIIVLDLTDPLSPVQTRRLQAKIKAELGDAPDGTLVALAAVGPESSERFIRCKPASGAGANALYQNATLLERQFQTDFALPLEGLLSSALQATKQMESPVLETLQDVLADLPDGRGQTRVLLVSDLLQNSAILSVYRGESWDSFAAARHDQRLSGALSGAEVEIIQLPRPDASDSVHRAAQVFWARYFDAQGVVAPPRVMLLGDL